MSDEERAELREWVETLRKRTHDLANEAQASMVDRKLLRQAVEQGFASLHEKLAATTDLAERGLSGIAERLDKINGRVRANETDVAGIQATCQTRADCARKGGITLTGKGAIVVAVALVVVGVMLASSPEVVSVLGRIVKVL